MSYDFFVTWESKLGAIVSPNAPLLHLAPPRYSDRLNTDRMPHQCTCASGPSDAQRLDEILMGVSSHSRFWYQPAPMEAHAKGNPLHRRAERLNKGALGGKLTYWQIMDERGRKEGTAPAGSGLN